MPAASVQAQRVAFVQAGLICMRLLVANIALMERYWPKRMRPSWRRSLNQLYQFAHFDGGAEEALLEKALGWASLTLSL